MLPSTLGCRILYSSRLSRLEILLARVGTSSLFGDPAGCRAFGVATDHDGRPWPDQAGHALESVKTGIIGNSILSGQPRTESSAGTAVRQLLSDWPGWWHDN